ncbi:uncharacterized protein N7482_010326 [Penicillium canariense]|uniref:Transposase MuDR plant domain-containing protein n=1 Tax=Penicillium canariense TaxID=189055 RepID=A0A9W9LDY3_9EURO|nr:uncharacterized protein N7482_010326 [Penicillium canariense]KAJ5151074.1 hypothetical protein N7482_010326 [Penicillium canariense]
MTEMYSGLHAGQRFSSLEEFKTVIRSISVRQHWELRVIRSNKKSVVIGCRSSANCYFRVVCRSNKNATYITSLQDSHSCRRSADSPAATPARSEASHVRFLLSEIPKLFDLNTRIKGQDVVDAVKRYHGYDISMRQAQRALTKLQPRQGDIQGEHSLDMDMSTGDQQSPGQSPPGSQGEAGPAYRDISENRWIPDHLTPSLMDDGSVNPADSPNHAPAPLPPPSAAQSVRPPQIQQPPPIGTSSQSALSSDTRPIIPQQGVGYPTAPPLPGAGPEHPKPPSYPQRNDHPTVPHMVLTNFKIEFTCTTCGSLNQSFFPNQGNVTGAGYIPHHAIQTQAAVTRHPGPVPPNASDGSSNELPEDGGYTVNAINARVMHNAWAAGGLGVPIGPANT